MSYDITTLCPSFACSSSKYLQKGYISVSQTFFAKYLQSQGTESGFNIKHPAIEVWSKIDFACSSLDMSDVSALLISTKVVSKGHPIIQDHPSISRPIYQRIKMNLKPAQGLLQSICCNTVSIKLYRNITLLAAYSRPCEASACL